MPLLLKSLATLLAVAPGYTFAAPRPDRTVERAASGTQMAVVTVTPMDKGEYAGDITIDGKIHKVVFDTGSDALWIKNPGPKGSGASFHQGYGSGSVNGTIAYGDVTVGGITVRNQAYGLVDETSGTDGDYDGLIGLGTSDTIDHETSWLKNVMPMLKDSIFVADLAPKAMGTFTFGYDNQSSSGTNGSGDDNAGSIPVLTGNGEWDIAANLRGLDDTIRCVLDTGTTDIVLPNDAYNAYISNVDHDGSHLPDFEVTSNGHTFTMPGKYAGTNGDRFESQDDDTYCILGQPFFYAFDVIYDYANKSVNIVAKA